ncbi:NO-inducible flavohemoprotein [Zymobacter palmae]|uniref:nitric oxide dioxygenase n=1 Tax=Zymobacter palmae TaxID=33074 RepID=A0A348HE70_9GAMM|nr:NO-inducible flavohemoprotein [Zymobacter palmae]BBG29922.1 hemoglobin-like flavoprotein [Zymobacter palmae]
MLTQAQKTIIQATVPLLESGGEALARHFYALMFETHPEVRALFNQTHQATGDQARALANSVLMYARHIDDLSPLTPLVSRIVNKHVALQILPEHYPIVGSCLLQSIREVLGANVATDEVLQAWGAAYQQLADLLIGKEEQHYEQNAMQPGGWRGSRRFRIDSIKQESQDVRSLTLAPTDGGPILNYQAGQYIGVRLMIEGEEVRRNYSISNRADGRSLRITLKHVPDGRASGYLHERQVGDELEIFPPAGDFILGEDKVPVALLTAGIGITPAIPLLEEALEQQRQVHFLHATHNSQTLTFGAFLAQQAGLQDRMTLKLCFSQPLAHDTPDAVGHIDSHCLRSWLPAGDTFHVYVLGPTGFMANMKALLLKHGVTDDRIHYECFGPHKTL